MTPRKPSPKSSAIRDRIVELRRLRAGDLLPDPRNYRRHPKAQRDALLGVLQEVGYADALLARETPEGLVLVDGHLRADLDPDQVVPVLVLDVTEEEAAKLLATLDPLAAMAETNTEALEALLREVSFQSQGVNEMLAALAKGSGTAAQGLTDPDAVQAPQGEPWVKRGDLFRLGEHRLLCGDATQDMAALLGGQAPKLLLTDPPYGISIVKVKGGRATGGNGQHDPKKQSLGASNRASGVMAGPSRDGRGVLKERGMLGEPSGRQGQGRRSPGIVQPTLYLVITGDDKPFDPAHLLGLCSVSIIFGANHFASRLPDSGCWLVWDKGMSPENSFSDAELVWTNQKGHVRMYRHTWSGLVREGSRDVESLRRLHPTQKPVGLLEQIMGDFSKMGDGVVDPYLGSGSTLIACERLGRVCFGMEIEPAYVQVAIERWEGFTGRKAERVS